MSPAECKNLTFREIQLLKVFRQCDERGRSLVEQIATDQSRISCLESAAPARLLLIKGGRRHDA